MKCNDRPIRVFINKAKYELEHREQTGKSLKELASIPLGDVLFLQQPGEDPVIANDASIELKNGNRLHSQPAADYGAVEAWLEDAGIPPDRVRTEKQPNGWTFLTISDYQLPEEFQPSRTRLLVKLPPLFPDAAPDMFWVNPPVRLTNGGVPKATSSEVLLGENWQRFSWHLVKGTWKAGWSTLGDFLRCVRGRFLRRN